MQAYWGEASENLGAFLAIASSTAHIYDCRESKKVTGISLCRFFDTHHMMTGTMMTVSTSNWLKGL
ncbi:hypothetical protein [Calothrix sp. UHCC 0171]|uniref:hypothetical protein n=1 Tax=Calothrix sp. UHCC 0171 TaxID=3110245 RepID=UPI002B1E93C2|nr:hypothetical protein [Calothrix sp. UHCC 0171]MEA5570055.1 hypothetical protein [Calothrix sp. UHCC 0171]